MPEIDERESTEVEALSMFFDDNFVPHAYLDALFNSTLSQGSKQPLTKTQLRSKLDSVATIQLLQSRCSSLLAHLDYYAKELGTDLEDRVKKLQMSSSVIAGLDDFDEDDSNNGIADGGDPASNTRIGFYLENLANSITSLHEDLDLYNRQIAEAKAPEEDIQIMNKLSTLKQIKNRILTVLKIFETAKAVATTSQLDTDFEQVAGLNRNGIAPTNNKAAQLISIDLDAFTKSLYLLEDAIDEELKTKEAGPIVKKIDNLISLLPLFKNLPKFHSAYSTFVSRIEAKRDL